MSRAHIVNWTCDRCGNSSRVRAKSDQKLPDGWSKLQPPEALELDLCASCTVIWDTSFKAFFAEFSGNQWIPLAGINTGGGGMTPRAKRVMTLAIDEARRLGHTYLGTEHMLLGLMREGEGIAAGVLEAQGVTLDKIRAAVELIVGKKTGNETADTLTEIDPEVGDGTE